jgi:antitoxin component YwqK of YwqJK toxin-antitoxin module
MESPARSRAKRYVIVLLMLACCDLPPETLSPESPDLTRQDGHLYRRGEKFTGALLERNTEGDTLSWVMYRDGVQHGITKKFYSNRVCAEQRFFQNGKQNGIAEGWYENGKQKFRYHFLNDVYHGSVEEWYASGARYRTANFVNGYEDGLQQQWYENGTLSANYIVKDGRTYGITGTMNCKTTAINDSLR